MNNNNNNNLFYKTRNFDALNLINKIKSGFLKANSFSFIN